MKFGMYTEIRDEKVVYMDAVTYDVNRMPAGFEDESAWVASGRNQPTVRLTSPTDGSRHTTTGQQPGGGSTSSSSVAIKLQAVAEDPGGAKLGTAGSIDVVRFYARDCLIGEVRTPPYELYWSPAVVGDFVLRANATDADGNVAVAEPVTIRVGNIPPSVRLTSPTTHANIASGASTKLRATATDDDGGGGAVTSVAFYAVRKGSSSSEHIGFGTVSSSEGSSVYELTWTPPLGPGGGKTAYSIYAVATDDGGANATSAYVGVTIGATISTHVVTPSEDATIMTRARDRDDNANYGGVEIFGRAPDSSTGEDQLIAGIWKVDLSGVVVSGVAEIRDAKLRLYADRIDGEGSVVGGNFSVWTTTGAKTWEETSVTFNNGPKRNRKLSVTKVTAKNTYVDFDVTSDVDATLKAGGDLSAVTYWVQAEDIVSERLVVQSIRSSNAHRPIFELTRSDVSTPTTKASTSKPPPCSSFVAAPAGTKKPPSSSGGSALAASPPSPPPPRVLTTGGNYTIPADSSSPRTERYGRLFSLLLAIFVVVACDGNYSVTRHSSLFARGEVSDG